MNDEQKFPTETIDLPSKGLIYPESNPLSSGIIELKIPTGREENILASKKLIKSNEVITKFLKSLIVDKTINLDDMITGDISALIYASRILAYGNEYQVKVTCPVCKTIHDISIDLNNCDLLELNEDLINRNNEFEYTFKKTGITIIHKLMTHADEKFGTQELKNLKKFTKLTGIDKELTIRLASIIIDIPEFDLPEGKRERLLSIEKILSNNIPSIDLKNFRTYLKKLQPNIDTTFSFECTECQYETDNMEVVLDTNFFWPSE